METVRQYSRDRLMENEETRVLRARHLEYFLALAETADKKLNGAEALPWLNTLETEHDNLRAALDWCLEDEEEQGVEAGLRMTGVLWQFWQTRGHLLEGRTRSAAALSASRRGARADEGAGERAQRSGHSGLDAGRHGFGTGAP